MIGVGAGSTGSAIGAPTPTHGCTASATASAGIAFRQLGVIHNLPPASAERPLPKLGRDLRDGLFAIPLMLRIGGEGGQHGGFVEAQPCQISFVAADAFDSCSFVGGQFIAVGVGGGGIGGVVG